MILASSKFSVQSQVDSKYTEFLGGLMLQVVDSFIFRETRIQILNNVALRWIPMVYGIHIYTTWNDMEWKSLVDA